MNLKKDKITVKIAGIPMWCTLLVPETAPKLETMEDMVFIPIVISPYLRLYHLTIVTT